MAAPALDSLPAPSTMSPDWRHRTSRRRLWALVTASYAVDVALVALFAAAGTVPWVVPAAHAVAAAVVSAGFFALLRRRITSGDPYWTVHQMAAATAVQLGGIVVAPELALVFLNVLFIVFAFGALRLSRQQAVFGWLMISAGTAAGLAVVWPRVGLPHQTRFEMLLLAASYSSTLARCAYVGLQGSWLREELQRTNEQLVAFSQRIDRMARHDELTDLMNRRSIRAVLEEQATLAERGLDTLSVALLDLDHFKQVNDGFGHAVGDDVLREFGRVAVRTLRVTDRVGRYGGEEFLCVLTCATVDEVEAAMERLRAAIATHAWEGLAPGLSVTVSIGIASFRPGQSVAELLRRADDALYDAKRRGRDRVILAA
jgi:diguanylate cyclase (GGDEF)-like protein